MSRPAQFLRHGARSLQEGTNRDKRHKGLQMANTPFKGVRGPRSFLGCSRLKEHRLGSGTAQRGKMLTGIRIIAGIAGYSSHYTYAGKMRPSSRPFQA